MNMLTKTKPIPDYTLKNIVRCSKCGKIKTENLYEKFFPHYDEQNHRSWVCSVCETGKLIQLRNW